MFTSNWGATAQAVLSGIGGAQIAAVIGCALVISLLVAIWSERHHDQAIAVFKGTLITGVLIAGAAWIVNLIPGL